MASTRQTLFIARSSGNAGAGRLNVGASTGHGEALWFSGSAIHRSVLGGMARFARRRESRALSKIWNKLEPGRRIGELDLHRLHKLRLRAKCMRYTIEFTRSLYDESHPKRIERVLNELGKLQSALGTLNDVASARAMLDRIAQEAMADRKNGMKPRFTSGLRAMLTADQERHKAEQLKKATKAFEKLENIKPFWI